MNWKEDYIKKIGCVDEDDLQIEAAQALKIRNLPEALYKYRPATDYAINNLENDTVYLNKPAEYNDPFEFVEFLDFNKINLSLNRQMKGELISTLIEQFDVPESIRTNALNSDLPMRVIAKYQLREYENRSEEDIEEILNVLDEILKKMIIDRHVEKIKSIQDKMKVCSFCESPKELLMWSHYADYHRGFCIEYSINNWANNDIRKRILYPVIYQNNFYDSSDHLISQIEKSTYNNLYPLISGATKSEDWEYEKEWRFIFNIGESFEKQNYPMNCQTKVFLGSRISQEKRNRIISICNSKGILAYDAIPSNDKYQLEFKPIETNATNT